VKIRKYIIIILPVVLSGLKLRLSRKDLRLRVFEKRELRRISVLKRYDVQGTGGGGIMRSFIICTPH